MTEAGGNADVELAQLLAAEIRRDGPIPFASFMAAALHAPKLGYYRRSGARIGRDGDFLTSPALGPAFGRTLGSLVLAMAASRPAEAIRVIDAGCGEGQLMAGLLAAPGMDALRPHLDVVLVEAGDSLRALAVARCRALGVEPRALGATSELGSLAPGAGILFANELFDALPVRRLRRRRGEIEECFVDLVEGRFVEVWQPASAAGGRAPREGCEIAVASGAEALLGELASGLATGAWLLIDYGYPRSVLDGEGGIGNPVRGFREGALASSLVDAPGSIDLTAHVDWTAISEAAAPLGLEVLFFTDQTYLLLACGFLDDPDAPARQRLIHPEDMGGTFKVLALGRGELSRPIRALAVRDRQRLLRP